MHEHPQPPQYYPPPGAMTHPNAPPIVAPLRREAGTLVAAKGSDLGGPCIKCGEPNAPHRRHVDITHIPPATWFALVLSLPAFVIIALLVRKKSGHWLNLCDPCNKAWDHSVSMSAASTIAVIGSFLGAGALFASEAIGAGAIMLLGGPLMGIAGLIIASKRRLRAKRIDPVEARIDGASERYLQQVIPPRALSPAPDHR